MLLGLLQVNQHYEETAAALTDPARRGPVRDLPRQRVVIPVREPGSRGCLRDRLREARLPARGPHRALRPDRHEHRVHVGGLGPARRDPRAPPADAEHPERDPEPRARDPRGLRRGRAHQRDHPGVRPADRVAALPPQPAHPADQGRPRRRGGRRRHQRGPSRRVRSARARDPSRRSPAAMDGLAPRGRRPGVRGPQRHRPEPPVRDVARVPTSSAASTSRSTRRSRHGAPGGLAGTVSGRAARGARFSLPPDRRADPLLGAGRARRASEDVRDPRDPGVRRSETVAPAPAQPHGPHPQGHVPLRALRVVSAVPYRL